MVLAEALTEAELLDILLKKPAAMWAFVLARFGPVAIGFGLAIWGLIRRQDRKRMGVPPLPMARVTVPFDLGQAALLLAAGFFIVPGVALYVLTGGDAEGASLWVQIGAMALGSVPVAVLVALRRQRLMLQAADRATQVADAFSDEAVAAPPVLDDLPTPPPSLGRATLLGLGAVCVALLVSTPLAIGWTLLIQAVTGEPPSLQGLVQDALDPDATYEPWLIAGYGVLLAPFVEEALFRGLMYPALYRVLARMAPDGSRRPMWVAMLVISLLFAVVHGNLLAIVPLFALAMVLNWVFQRTNSLAAVVVAHAAHNALSMIPVLMLRVA